MRVESRFRWSFVTSVDIKISRFIHSLSWKKTVVYFWKYLLKVESCFLRIFCGKRLLVIFKNVSCKLNPGFGGLSFASVDFGGPSFHSLSWKKTVIYFWKYIFQVESCFPRIFYGKRWFVVFGNISCKLDPVFSESLVEKGSYKMDPFLAPLNNTNGKIRNEE